MRLGANAAAARDPAKRALLDKKEQLEQAIDKLKYEKAAMPADRVQEATDRASAGAGQDAGGARQVRIAHAARACVACARPVRRCIARSRWRLRAARALEQAEALWKARRLPGRQRRVSPAGGEIPQEPRLPRALGPPVPRSRPIRRRRGPFQGSAGTEERSRRRAARPGADRRRQYYGRAPRNWRGKALAADPKLLEAQELLARLALEDNDNAKAETEAKKALALDSNSVEGKAILAAMDWLADKKETPWDPHDARGYETAGHFFMINRRYEEAIAVFPQGDRPRSAALDSARSQLGINLMRLGRNEEAHRRARDLLTTTAFRTRYRATA